MLWRIVARSGGGNSRVHVQYQDIISVENLLGSWQEFLRGKRKRSDVAEFALHLGDNVIELHRELAVKDYRHDSYEPFKICDPKPRQIHKASVRDRLVHHAIYRTLYPYFDRYFIHDSYSCRKGKGTHRAINRFRQFGRQVSRNNTRTCWVLQCDIRRFFASIDHEILLRILRRHIVDEDVLWLLGEVIQSFDTQGRAGIGLPLGNLTSQLLVNVYMNQFDQWMKRRVKAKYYIRYADDFVILHESRAYLGTLIPKIAHFLGRELCLSLHPKKLTVRTLASGIDFLGWVHFPHHRVLRTCTKRRMLKRVRLSDSEQSRQSYVGLLSHGNAYQLARVIERL